MGAGSGGFVTPCPRPGLPSHYGGWDGEAQCARHHGRPSRSTPRPGLAHAGRAAFDQALLGDRSSRTAPRTPARVAPGRRWLARPRRPPRARRRRGVGDRRGVASGRTPRRCERLSSPRRVVSRPPSVGADTAGGGLLRGACHAATPREGAAGRPPYHPRLTFAAWTPFSYSPTSPRPPAASSLAGPCGPVAERLWMTPDGTLRSEADSGRGLDRPRPGVPRHLRRPPWRP